MVFRGQLEQEGFPVDFSKGVTTETGAGQWGTALSMACGLTGTEYFDMVAYEKFHDGKMDNYIPTDEEIAESLSKLPTVEQQKK